MSKADTQYNVVVKWHGATSPYIGGYYGWSVSSPTKKLHTSLASGTAGSRWTAKLKAARAVRRLRAGKPAKKLPKPTTWEYQL